MEQRKQIKEPEDSDEYVNKICKINEDIQNHAIIAVIFSALTLEAFINNYGISLFSLSYFDNYLDKLDFVSKWLILPKLVVNKELNTSHQPFQLLNELYSLRNKLVHSKTYKRKLCDIEDKDWIMEKDAIKAIETVILLTKELKKLDKNIDITWLEHEIRKSKF